MLKQQEGVAAFKWFVEKWHVLLPFITPAAEHKQQSARKPSSASGLTSREKLHRLVEWQVSRRLQHYLIGMLIFLGGGQRLQVYAELLDNNLFHDEDDLLVIYVNAEKVPHQNID
jgi:hypothetical protein